GKRMPIAHGHGHASIEIPVELAFEGNSLAPGKFEQRRFAADAGIMMRHVFGAPGGNQPGQWLSRDPRKRKVDDIRIAKQIVEKGLNGLDRVRAAKLK